MRTCGFNVRLAWIIAVALNTGVASAQSTLSEFYSFAGGGPAQPLAGLVQAPDGNYYGTTSKGGTFDRGTVYKVTPAGVVTTVHSFRWGQATDGAIPAAPLVVGPDGHLYGTSRGGGAGCGGGIDCGTLYRITASGIVTVLHRFDQVTGARPSAALTLGSDANFYGVAPSGGAFDDGTAFRLTPGGTFTLLHSFSSTIGRFPQGLVRAADGNFYGAVSIGPNSNLNGAIFRMTPAGVVTTLHVFGGNAAGQSAVTLLAGQDGHLYGTTVRGGTSGLGTFFRVTLAGVHTVLHSFTSTAYEALGTPLHANDGNLYGTTYFPGAGSVYRITPQGTFAVVHSFPGVSPGPWGGLIQGSDGALRGTTLGTPTSAGAVFAVSTSGAVTSIPLPSSGGTTPIGALTVRADGQLSGTTEFGGATAQGTIFRSTLSGPVSEVYSLPGFPGSAYDRSTLLLASDGNYYGTTWGGGAFRRGTVYRMTASGLVTVLHSFSGSPSASNPRNGLTEAADGNFYGTSFSGGAQDSGTVYRLTREGTLSVLYSFTGADGSLPSTRLVEGEDGALYGLDDGIAGPNGARGGVFRVSTGGAFSIVHAFAGGPLDGSVPNDTSALTRARDGTLYGTTVFGGANQAGTIFKIAGGALSVLHSFGAGASFLRHPHTTLLEGSDGSLYGATGGSEAVSIPAAIFRFHPPTGAVSLMHQFSGIGPYASPGPTDGGLVQGPDGHLYGLTSYGGTNGVGSLFRVTLPAAPPGFLAHPSSVAGPVGQTISLGVRALGAGPLNYQWYENVSARVPVPIAGATSATLDVSVTSATLGYWVRVSNAFGTADSRVATVQPLLLAPPTGLMAAAIAGNVVTLRWVAPSSSLSPTSYVIEGGVQPGQTLGAIDTGGTDTRVTFSAPSGTFFARVYAISGTTRSSASNEILIRVNIPAPPSAPVNLLGTVSGSGVWLSWTETFEGGPSSAIVLEVTGALTGALTLPRLPEVAAFSPVPPGTYTIGLRTTNAHGTSSMSNTVTVTVPSTCTAAPGPPTAVQVRRSGRALTLDWQPPVAGGAVLNYVVTVRGTLAGAVTVPGRSVSGTVGPGTYEFAVAAAGVCGLSSDSPRQVVTVP